MERQFLYSYNIDVKSKIQNLQKKERRNSFYKEEKEARK